MPGSCLPISNNNLLINESPLFFWEWDSWSTFITWWLNLASVGLCCSRKVESSCWILLNYCPVVVLNVNNLRRFCWCFTLMWSHVLNIHLASSLIWSTVEEKETEINYYLQWPFAKFSHQSWFRLIVISVKLYFISSSTTCLMIYWETKIWKLI